MAYTYRRTGSARSVGKRRSIKYYATADGRAVAARSAAGARQDAMLAATTLTGLFADPKTVPVIDRRIAAPAKKVAKAGGIPLPVGGTSTKATMGALTPLKAGTAAWTTGQFASLKGGVTQVHWNGTAWAAGAAP